MTTVIEENIRENVDSAYVNLALLSDDIWVFNSHTDSYKKHNKDLWLNYNNTEQKLFEADKDNYDISSCNTFSDYPRTVRNIIPTSRLAQYGDYLYDEKREQLYTSNDMPADYIPDDIFDEHGEVEVWMLPEVEEEFKRLTFVSSSRWCSSSPNLSINETIFPTSIEENEVRNWLTSTPWPRVLLLRYPDLPCTLQDTNKSIFNDSTYFPKSNSFSGFGESNNCYSNCTKKKNEYPVPRFMVSTNEELQLFITHTCPSVKEIWQKPNTLLKNPFSVGSSGSKLLNADVPEFQPKKKRNDFPSFYDFSYESDLFPYWETAITPNIVPPISCNVSGIPDTTGNMIPVYQRPPEFYCRTENGTNQKKRTVGADLNNLIFLTQDEGGNYKGLQTQYLDSFQIIQAASQRLTLDHFPQLPQHSGQGKSSNKKSCQEMLVQVNKWLERVYPVRSNNFNDMSSTSKKMENLATKVQNNNFLLKSPTEMDFNLDQTTSLPEKPAVKRRLYRDVLTSGGCCSDIENKFEELEREALEQYAGSDTNFIGKSTSEDYSPSEDMVTRTYQDLEREAVEQYQEIESNEFNSSLNEGGYYDSMNMNMIPIVKAPYPSPPSSTGKDSCLSQSSGNSQTGRSTRGTLGGLSMSSETSHLNSNRTQVITMPWVQMCKNYSEKPPAWMKKKKKKAEKKKKNMKQKKKSNSDSSKETLGKICELLKVYFQLKNYLEFIFFNNLFLWNINTNLIKYGLYIVVESISEFKSLMCELYLSKERKYSKKKIHICYCLISLTVKVVNSIARYLVATNCKTLQCLEENKLVSLECLNINNNKIQKSIFETPSNTLCSHMRNKFSNPIYPFQTMMSINEVPNCPCLVPQISLPGTDFLPAVLITPVKQVSIVLNCKKILKNVHKKKLILCRDFNKNLYLSINSSFCKTIHDNSVNKTFWLNEFSVDYLNLCLKYNLYLCIINSYIYQFQISVDMSPKYSLIWDINTKSMSCFSDCGQILGLWYKDKGKWFIDELYITLDCFKHKKIGICSKCGKWDFLADNITSHEKCIPLSFADHLIDPLFKAADRGVNPTREMKIIHKNEMNNKQLNNEGNDNKIVTKTSSLFEDLSQTDKICVVQ